MAVIGQYKCEIQLNPGPNTLSYRIVVEGYHLGSTDSGPNVEQDWQHTYDWNVSASTPESHILRQTDQDLTATNPIDPADELFFLPDIGANVLEVTLTPYDAANGAQGSGTAGDPQTLYLGTPASASVMRAEATVGGDNIVAPLMKGTGGITMTFANSVIEVDGSGAGGATTLADLTDTTITTPGPGDFLRYNGSTWLNTLLVAGDIPSLDAAKITTGTFATARIPDLDAAKITSGTFADARIAESNVTQHEAALSVLGIEALSDPNADRIFFWDDSAGTGGAFAFLEVAGGLEIPVAAPTTIQVDVGDGIALSGGEVVFDASVLNDEGVAMVAGDRFVIWDSGEAGTGSRQMNPVNIPLSLFNDDLGFSQNVEGAGITLSTTTGTNDTIALDYVGTDNYILDTRSLGTLDASGTGDRIPFSDNTDNTVYYATPQDIVDVTAITEGQITDGSILARVAANETISGSYTFSNQVTTFSNGNAEILMDGSGTTARTRITRNDGGGNFNIRNGNYYSSGPKYSNAGNGAVHVEINTDSQVGLWRVKASNSTAVSAGDTVTWNSFVQLTNGAFAVSDSEGGDDFRVTTAGLITAGEWDATTIAVDHGGTGISGGIAADQFLIGDGAANPYVASGSNLTWSGSTLAIQNATIAHSGTGGFTGDGSGLSGVNADNFDVTNLTTDIGTYYPMFTDGVGTGVSGFVNSTDLRWKNTATANQLLLANGAEATPILAFINDEDTGIFGNTAEVSVATGGTERFRVTNATTLSYGQFFVIRPTGNSVMTRFRREDNTDLAWDVRIDTGGTYEIRSVTDAGATVLTAFQMEHATGDLTLKGWIRSEDGSAGSPTYSFSNDANTGMYSAAADVLSFATGGSERVYINNTAMYTDALVDTTTRIGQTSHSLVALDAASDFAKPSGYRTMASNASLEKPNGNGTAWTTYYHWNVMSRRDSGGGYYGLALGYNSGRMWYGQNSVNTALPNWYEIWNEATPQALPTADGSASAPFYSFNSESGTGMYYTSSQLNWTIAGTRQMALNQFGLFLSDPTQTSLFFEEIDAAANEGNYRITATGGDLLIQAATDAGAYTSSLAFINNGSGVANVIYSYATLRPDIDSSKDLGTNSFRWANLYVDTATLTNALGVGSGGTGISGGIAADQFLIGDGTANPYVASGSNLTWSGSTLAIQNATIAHSGTGGFTGNGSGLTGVVSDSSTVTDLTTQTATYYPIMADGTSGAISHFVDASELSYTSSTDTLNVVSLAASSDVTIGTNADLVFSGGSTSVLTHTNQSTRDKIRVWNSSLYTIGMQNSFTFGPLVTDYAMTFQMNDDPDRGFWWGDTGHGQSGGAMALSTTGYLTLARHMRLGYGEADTANPSSTIALDISMASGATTAIDINGLTTGDYILDWGGTGYTRMTKITDQGGFSIGCDSSMVIQAGDTLDATVTGLGIVGSTTSEVLYLASDASVVILPNQQSAFTQSQEWVFGTNGTLQAQYFGASGTPTYSWQSDPDTGMRLQATGILRLSAGTDDAYLDVDAVNNRLVANRVLLINEARSELLRLDSSGAFNPYVSFYIDGNRHGYLQYLNSGEEFRFVQEESTGGFFSFYNGSPSTSTRRFVIDGLGNNVGRTYVENSQFYVEEDQTVLTVAATVTCDWDRSNQLHLTITNTVTTIAIDDSSMQPGGSYILMVQEGTSAPSSVTWSSTDTIFWANGTAPVLNGGDLNDITVVQFFKTTAGSNTRIIGSWFLAQ